MYNPLSEKIYLAGPWFTPEQMKVQQTIEGIAKLNGWSIFSPRLELLLTPQSTHEDRARCFFMNNRVIMHCRLVLANVEGYDTGTLWEMGAAFAYNTRVVAYSVNPERKLNVMLAQGCVGFLAGWEAIKNFLTPPSHDELNWKVATPWTKEVF